MRGHGGELGTGHDHTAVWCQSVCSLYGGQNLFRSHHQRFDPVYLRNLDLPDADQLCTLHLTDFARFGLQQIEQKRQTYGGSYRLEVQKCNC